MASRRNLLLIFALGSLLIGMADRGRVLQCRADSPADVSQPERDERGRIVPVHKSDDEWRKLLTRRQFEVTRRAQTESPHSGRYLHYRRAGSYRCVCCELALFDSQSKFRSGTPWPSFFQPVEDDRVVRALDVSQLPPRLEVRCGRCEAHLGHVFDDGPAPTGLRYCINSAALKFVPSPESAAERSPPR